MPADRFRTIKPRTALVVLAFGLLQIFGIYRVILLTLQSLGAIWIS